MEGFVVSLVGCFNEILEVGFQEEVVQVYEFVVVFIFNVDDILVVLMVMDLFVVDNNGFFRVYDGKGYKGFDAVVQSMFFFVEFFIVVGEYFEVVEGEFFFNVFFEFLVFLDGKSVGFGDDGNNVDDIRQFFQDDNVNGFERVVRRLNEEQVVVDMSVLNVVFVLCCEFFV